MPNSPLQITSFGGGINESADAERIAPNEVASARNFQMFDGALQRRAGWKPLQDRITPFFPSTRAGHLIIPSMVGEACDSGEWSIQFWAVIEEKSLDGEKYGILARTMTQPVPGSADPGMTLYLYWIDDDETPPSGLLQGGLYLGYSDSTHSPAGGVWWNHPATISPPSGTRVATSVDLPDAGVRFQVSIVKRINGAQYDLEVWLDGIQTGSIVNVGSDSLADLLFPASSWELGFSWLDLYSQAVGAEGLELAKPAPWTFGEFRVWDGAIDTDVINDWQAIEAPASAEIGAAQSLEYHIPLRDPRDGYFPGKDTGTGATAYHAVFAGAAPIITSGLGYHGAGFLFNGFGASAQIFADEDFATQIVRAVRANPFFFSVSGVAYGPGVFLTLPQSTDAPHIEFGIMLRDTVGELQVYITDNAGITWSGIEVVAGLPFTASVHWNGLASPDWELRFVVTQSGTTTEAILNQNVLATSGVDEPRPRWRIGGKVAYGQSRWTYRRAITPSGTFFGGNMPHDQVLIDRILMAVGEHLPGFPHEELDAVSLRSSSSWWDRLDFIFQPPAEWAENQQAPRFVATQRGTRPEVDSGQRAVVLRMEHVRPSAVQDEPLPGSETREGYVASYRLNTVQFQDILSQGPVPVLWVGDMRLRSSPNQDELAMAIVPGGVIGLNADGSVSELAGGMTINPDALPDVIRAQGFLAVQGRRNNATKLFDGSQVYDASPRAPSVLRHSLTPASGSLTGNVRYAISFYNGSSGQESGLKYLWLVGSNGTDFDAPAGDDVTLEWEPEEAEPGTTVVRIYRTETGLAQGRLFRLAEVLLEEGTYTDDEPTILNSNPVLFYSVPNGGGFSLVYHEGRAWWSDPLAPEILIASPEGRLDRVETTRIAPAPVRQMLSTRRAIIGLTDDGMVAITGTDPQTFFVTQVSKDALPASKSGGSPIVQHPQGFLIYWTGDGIVADGVESRNLISVPVEATVQALDKTRTHKQSIGVDTRLGRILMTGFSSPAATRPDLVFLWTGGREGQGQLWEIFRLEADFIGQVTIADKRRTIFVVGGWIATLEGEWDGYDGEIAGISNNGMTVASSLTTRRFTAVQTIGLDGRLTGVTLRRQSTGELLRVATNFGDDVILETAASSTILPGEVFRIGPIVATATLRAETPSHSARYVNLSSMLVRGSGGILVVSVTADKAYTSSKTFNLDLNQRSMYVNKSGRRLQVALGAEDAVRVESVEMWLRMMEVRR